MKLERELAALETMSAAELKERWSELAGTPAPGVPPSLLKRLVAQRLQEKRHGRLPQSVLRKLERIAAGDQPKPAARRVELTPGTRLVREWNGRTIAVEVTASGFEHDGRTWRSLSHIARHVTGAQWSGPRFFGLVTNG